MILMNNVLFVGPYNKSGKGGVNSVLRTYERYLDEFFCISTFPVKYRIFNYFVFPFVVARIWVNLFFSKTRIIHIHGASYGSFYRKYIIFKLIKLFSSKKVIYHIHGANYKLFSNNANVLTKYLLRDMIQNVDMVVCLSQSWRDYFTKKYRINKIRIINNIVPYPSLKEKRKCNAPIVKFLFLGRIGDRKGVFDLLQIIAKERNYLRGKFHLTIGGDGEVVKLNKIIQENNIFEFVEFVGWVDFKNKEYLLKNSDVFILPSYNEGLPISILEAMSYDLPIISTLVGGIPEIIKGNGFVVEPGNFKDIFESIKKMIEGNREEFSAASKELIKYYYPEFVLCQLKEMYNEIK